MATQQVEIERSGQVGHQAPPLRHFFGLIGDSAAMRQLYALIEKVAPTDLRVVVRGETGCGKDLVVRAIHELSSRSRGPFVVQSLKAIPETLVESELFGYVRGAFTGAEDDHRGVLSQASGGTLCLSDIDEISLDVQTKILQVLESRRVRPLGANAALPVDFRLVVGTRKDLRRAVSAGAFAEDLLYRILGVEVVVPPLREHRDDIPLLVEHFLARESGHRQHRAKVEPEALKRLTTYDWPGNVRELENEMRRLAILAPDRIRPEDLLLRAPAKSEPPLMGSETMERLNLKEAHDAIDHAYFKNALKRCGNNMKAVARFLGVHERTVYKIRKRLGL